MKMRFAAGAMTLASLFAAPLQAEVVQAVEGGFVTRDSATVEAEPQDVWLELITPGNWWNDSHTWSADASNMTLTPQGGGCFCERIPAEDEDGVIGLAGSVQHMVVLQANPRKVLRMSGALGPLQSEPVVGVLTITIRAVDGGSRINWEYVVGGFMRYPVADISKAVDAVMSQQLDGLAQKLGRIDVAETAPQEPAETEEVEAGTDEPAERDVEPDSAIGDDFLDGVETDGNGTSVDG